MCVVATFVLSEDTCRFEHAENSCAIRCSSDQRESHCAIARCAAGVLAKGDAASWCSRSATSTAADFFASWGLAPGGQIVMALQAHTTSRTSAKVWDAVLILGRLTAGFPSFRVPIPCGAPTGLRWLS